jgi:hypothetical protein
VVGDEIGEWCHKGDKLKILKNPWKIRVFCCGKGAFYPLESLVFYAKIEARI